MLSRLIAFLRGGTRTFNSAEMKIISFVLAALPEGERRILALQVAAVSLVQRPQPGRMVVAFYPHTAEVPTLSHGGYEYGLANVTYRSKGTNLTTSLVLHNGRLMSLERNVPAALESVELPVQVVLHPKGHTAVSSEIDAEEHGARG